MRLPTTDWGQRKGGKEDVWGSDGNPRGEKKRPPGRGVRDEANVVVVFENCGETAHGENDVLFFPSADSTGNSQRQTTK